MQSATSLVQAIKRQSTLILDFLTPRPSPYLSSSSSGCHSHNPKQDPPTHNLDMSASPLLAVLLLALLAIVSATPTTPPPSAEAFTAFIPPPIPTTYVHPLLATINYPTTPQDIQPGRLNHFNFSRPEGTRQFYLYVPTTYSNATAWPFTFYFHGYQDDWQQGVSLNQTDDAEAAGYLIAFGQGTRSSTGNVLGWNGGVCCLFNATWIVDDVQFAREAVKMVQAAVNVDPTRIYSTGWSNGGYMSERLACEAGELFAGICADASAVGIWPGGLAGLASCVVWQQPLELPPLPCHRRHRRSLDRHTHHTLRPPRHRTLDTPPPMRSTVRADVQRRHVQQPGVGGLQGRARGGVYECAGRWSLVVDCGS